MFGPVAKASSSPSDIPSAVIVEALAIFLLSLGVFGHPRLGTSPTSIPSRLLGALILLTIGSVLLLVSVPQLWTQGFRATAVLVFAATAAPVCAYQLLSWRKYRGWQSWPVVEATVESVSTREVRTRNSHYWTVEVAYSYVANSEYQAGSYTKYFAQESEADEYADSIRGQKLLVRFNSDRPDLSRYPDADS